METKLLDLPISFFEYDHQRGSFAHTPSQQTTLRRIVSTKYYQVQIEAIRAEPDKAKQDENKKQLPSFTPVALLCHRKKDTSFAERIINQWPMGMGDIDTKENPGINMVELKQQIASLPYVLLCAYSVRRGLWFVVRLPDNQTPDTLAAHFRYLQRLFTEKFGIKLDSTKGSNPTALRFVSFDEEPYFNDEATVMEGTYTPPQPKRPAVNVDELVDEDSGKLLKRLLKPVENAGEGQRHEALLKAARLGGGMIAANRLDEQTVILALETVASEWPTFDKSQKTIRDGIKNGLTAPVYPDVRERPAAWKVESRKPKPAKVVVDETFIDEEWPPFDYSLEAKSVTTSEPSFLTVVRKVDEHPQPIEPTFPSQLGKVEQIDSTPFRLPWLVLHYWELFARPPYVWNRIRAHKAVIRFLNPEQPKEVVTTIDEQYNSPGSLLRPLESQLERLTVEPCDTYPPEGDEPSAAGAVPQIKALTFQQFQQQNPYFSQMGLASLLPRQHDAN